MAVNSHVDGHPLPCGRLVEDVFADLEAGRLDEHGLCCEHCATARLSLENLSAATQALVEDTAEPPPALLDRVMQAVRADLRRGDVLPLPTELGPADISEQAVAAVLRYAADTVPGVRARSCRITINPGRIPAVQVRMSLSLRYGTGPAERLFSDIRRRIGAALAGQIGLFADTIDLEVVDLWPEETR